MVDKIIPDRTGTGAFDIARFLALLTGNGTGATSATTMNKAAKRSRSAQQATVAGLNSLLRVVYGRQRVGALLGKPKVLADGRTMVMPCFWCHGEIAGFDSIQIDDEAIDLRTDTSINPANYVGTTVQGVDPTLLSAYGPGFTDTYPGVAYSVMRIHSTKGGSGFPLVTAIIRGRKVRPTITGARVYSTNPALHLADYIEDRIYGASSDASQLSVNWTDVATCVAACDAMVGTPPEKARTMNLVLDQSFPSGQWIDVMRDYANVWVVPEGSELRMIPDVTGADEFTYDNSHMVLGSVRGKKRAARNQPTGVEIVYTDTTDTRYVDRSVFAYLPGVKEGTSQRRMARIAMPGLTSKSEATRRAIERLNNYTLGDFEVSFTAFDSAIKRRIGDLGTIAHPGWGNLAKRFRLKSARASEPGRWALVGLEFDPLKYSSEVQTEASTPDTALPSASSPLPVQDLIAVEVRFQTTDGLFSSRIKVSWTEPAYPFIGTHKVEIFKDTLDGEKVAGADSIPSSYTSGPVAEGVTYAVRVTLFSTTGVESDPATTSVTVVGKTAVPSDIPSIAATVNGNVTRITYVLPADNDLSSVELRWGATSLGTDTAAYLAATLLNRIPVPQTTAETTIIPTGTWRIFAKAHDSIRTTEFPNGHESANPVYVDVTIAGAAGGTPPPAPVIGDDLEPSGVALVNMTLNPQTGCWTTDMADLWSALFPNAMSTYTNALATYHTSGTSSLTTTAIDLGVSKTATFKWVGLVYTNLSGAATAYIETSPDNSTWTRQAAGLSYQGTARYIRGAIETLTTGTLQVCNKGRFQVQVDGVAVAITQADKQNQIGRRRVWVNMPQGNGQANIGAGSASLVGTGTAGATPTYAGTFLDAAERLKISTPTGSSNQGTSRVSATTMSVFRGNATGLGGFLVIISFGISIIHSDSRWAAGLRNSAATPSFTVDPSTFVSSIQIGQDTGDTNIQVMSHDGASGLTKVNLGASWPRPTATDWYECVFSALPNAASVDWILRNRSAGTEITGTITATLPDATTPLRAYNYLTNGPTLTTVCTMDLGNMYVEAPA